MRRLSISQSEMFYNAEAFNQPELSFLFSP
jgi:hypothetical protein